MSAPPLFRLSEDRQVAVVRDAAAVRRVLDADPVVSCMVAARVADYGVDPTAIGGELWTRRHPEESLCFAGANLIPLRGSVADLTAFAEKALSGARRCSSLVGPAELVLPMWQRLDGAWGPARDVREQQPLMALSTAPSSPVDPAVRRVRLDELDAYLIAAVDMFIGEVGIDPRVGDGGRGYRRRIANLIAAGRAWARFEHGEVIFKAEVGSQSPHVGQIQGCGCTRIGAATGWARPGPPPWGRPWWPAVGSRACTSTATTRSRARPMSARASPRWVPSRRCCSTELGAPTATSAARLPSGRRHCAAGANAASITPQVQCQGRQCNLDASPTGARCRYPINRRHRSNISPNGHN